MTDNDRRRFAVRPASGEFDEIDLALLDPADEDDRRILILAEHPELRVAIEDDHDEICINGLTMSPRLHLVMHEIVANQLWDDNPPEVWQTAQRLVAAGYDRHEVLHMIGSVVSADIYRALHDQLPPDLDKTRAALAALPESWEQQRDEIPAERHQNRAERRAAARKHRR